ncbi:MAG: T9SS type A sorting domain-containing protein [Bacteroidota bacterium]
MKKSLLLFFVFIGLASTALQAQCVPDKSLFDIHVPPNYLFPPPFDAATMTGGFDDTACVGRFYEIVLNFVIPREVEFNGATLVVSNITVDGITGIPDGLSVQCTPASCVFEPMDSVACVLLSGTIDASVAPGDYELGIDGTANVGFPIPLNTLIAASGGGTYFVRVIDSNSPDCVGVATRELLSDQLRIRSNPNPFSEQTTIEINSDLNEDFEFRVLNTLGATVHQREVRLDRGGNQISFDGSDLSEGLYIYVLSNASGYVSGKLLLQR